MAWAAYMLTDSLPYWPIDPSIVADAVVQLPARFRPVPLDRAAGVRAVGRERSRSRWPRWRCRGDDPARLVGRPVRRQHDRRHRRVTRAPACSSWSGSAASTPSSPDRGQRGLGAARALAGRRAAGRPERRDADPLARSCLVTRRRRNPARRRCAVHAVPGLLVAYGRYAATRVGQAEFIYVGEGLNAVGGRLAARRRHAQLPQRGQGAGLERAPGHAAAADARPPDDADPEEPALGPRHRVRRGRHRRRRVDRPARRARRRSRRSSRSSCAPSRPTSASTTSTSSATRRSGSDSTTPGTSC